MITFKELHSKTLPEYKRKYVKMDVVSYYLWRPVCDLISILLMNTPVSATGVTIVSFYACLAALGCFIFVPGMTGALLGYLGIWIWNICDGIDGNLARYRGKCTRSGDLWDAVGGYAAMAVFFLGAGIVASKECPLVSIDFLGSSDYVIMGAVASLCEILPRLATQKKQAVYGAGAASVMKDRTSFGPAKILAVNITSVNGLAGLLLLIAIIFRLTNIFVIGYFFVMLLFGAASLYSVMRRLED